MNVTICSNSEILMEQVYRDALAEAGIDPESDSPNPFEDDLVRIWQAGREAAMKAGAESVDGCSEYAAWRGGRFKDGMHGLVSTRSIIGDAAIQAMHEKALELAMKVI